MNGIWYHCGLTPDRETDALVKSGTAFDTDTAEFLEGGRSQRCFPKEGEGHYRMRYDVFFLQKRSIVIGNSAAIDLVLLTDEQAQK